MNNKQKYNVGSYYCVLNKECIKNGETMCDMQDRCLIFSI